MRRHKTISLLCEYMLVEPLDSNKPGLGSRHSGLSVVGDRSGFGVFGLLVALVL